MGHGHDHDAGRIGKAGALGLALALTAGFTVVEVVAGFLTDSLAVLAVAAHMLSDNVSIALALFAVWIAAKPPTPERTYGFKRVEILVALVNGATLVLVSLWIFYEAFQRFQDPPDVLGGWMLAIAVIGLFVNLAAAAILSRSRGGSLNLEAAFRHVLDIDESRRCGRVVLLVGQRLCVCTHRIRPVAGSLSIAAVGGWTVTHRK